MTTTATTIPVQMMVNRKKRSHRLVSWRGQQESLVASNDDGTSETFLIRPSSSYPNKKAEDASSDADPPSFASLCHIMRMRKRKGASSLTTTQMAFIVVLSSVLMMAPVRAFTICPPPTSVTSSKSIHHPQHRRNEFWTSRHTGVTENNSRRPRRPTYLMDSEVATLGNITTTTNRLQVHSNGRVTLQDTDTATSSTTLRGNTTDHHYHNSTSLGGGDEEVPLPTENGGYTHTTASKAKISAANKGKTPWNKGRTRSPEERARIAAGVRAKNRERFLAKLAAMNMTEAEYEAQRAQEKRRKAAERAARRTENGGYRPTTETRQKISRILKEKYARGEVQRTPIDPSKVRRGFTHSAETRAKISASLRQRWATDEEYRHNMRKKCSASHTRAETRRKISESLRQKWQDPEFRNEMLSKRSTMTKGHTHRERISETMKLKWQDDEYRQKTLASIARRKQQKSTTSSTGGSSSSSSSSSRPVKQRKPVTAAVPRGVVAKKSMPRTAVVAKPASVRIAESSSSLPQRESKLKGEAPGLAPLQPRTASTASSSTGSTTKAKKARIKKVVVKKKKPASTAATGTTAKKSSDEPKPDGSVSRLREERRDLYDLLYGDEDDGNGRSMNNKVDGNEMVNAVSRSPLASLLLDDQNLDTFDPYGLDDF
eukprot:scaffold2904_cov173-Amphora_coffeaeformis.AAC.11